MDYDIRGLPSRLEAPRSRAGRRRLRVRESSARASWANCAEAGFDVRRARVRENCELSQLSLWSLWLRFLVPGGYLQSRVR